jgi:hypothetical protein
MAEKNGRRGKTRVRNGGISAEARYLAQEAMDEMKQGNNEEALFVTDETRDLEGKAADEVAQEQEKGRG